MSSSILQAHSFLDRAAELEEALCAIRPRPVRRWCVIPPVAQVVDVVDFHAFGSPATQSFTRYLIAASQSSARNVISSSGTFSPELAIDAESADAAQPIAVGVEEFFVEQGLGLFQLRRIAGPQPLIDAQARASSWLAVLSSARAFSKVGFSARSITSTVLQAGGADRFGGVLW